MSISPLEIRKHEFRKKLRGYDPDEVAAFLDLISVEMENLVHENVMSGEKVKVYENQLKKYRDIESTLQDTLLSAQKAREDTLSAANKQAEIIVREAEIKAAAVYEDTRIKIVHVKNVLNDLMINKETYLSKLKTLISSQLEIFDKLSFPEEELVSGTEYFSENDRVMPDKSDKKHSFAKDDKSMLFSGRDEMEDDDMDNEERK